MRKKSKIRIDGKEFQDESVFCDICGWGDQMIFTDIHYEGRVFDFCKRHPEPVVRIFVTKKLPRYKPSVKPLKNKEILKMEKE